MYFVLFFALTVANGLLGFHYAREKEVFESSMYWFGCGLWCSIILKETMLFLHNGNF